MVDGTVADSSVAEHFASKVYGTLVLSDVLIGEPLDFCLLQSSMSAELGGLAFTAYAYLVRRTTPTRLGTYGYVNPAIAAVLGWLVLNERLTGVQLLGMGITLGGVLLINWPRRS